MAVGKSPRQKSHKSYRIYESYRTYYSRKAALFRDQPDRFRFCILRREKMTVKLLNIHAQTAKERAQIVYFARSAIITDIFLTSILSPGSR